MEIERNSRDLVYISEIVKAEYGVTGISKSIHQEHGIIVKAMDIRVVKQNIPVSLSWKWTSYVRRCLFDGLYLPSSLARMEISGQTVVARRDRQVRIGWW
jgi:hypothetical protein